MKARLRSDLKLAMQERAVPRVRALRNLIAALDNAEAVPPESRHERYLVHAFGDGSAEVARLRLTQQDVDAVLLAEAASRRAAAAELAALNRSAEAEALNVEAALIEGYRLPSE